jgi:hypothetical protein
MRRKGIEAFRVLIVRFFSPLSLTFPQFLHKFFAAVRTSPATD